MAAPMFKLVLRISYVGICRNFRNFKVLNEPKILIRSSRVCQRFLSTLNTTRCYSSAEKRICWKCSTEISNETLVCPKCNILQNLDKNLNYFKLFGIEESFKVNTSGLSEKHRVMQAICHPDKFASKTQREREISSECSSFLTDAYKTILDDVSRSEYLLRLNGEDVVDPGMEMEEEFLEQMMNTNEILSGGKHEERQLYQMDDENHERTKDALDKIHKAFREKSFKEAKMLLAKLKFYENVGERIKMLYIKYAYVR